MSTRNPRVDAYINNAAEFAQPILRHLRETVHAASPEIQETIKWGAPCFEYKGILCNMAAFKLHCALAFWKESLIIGGDTRKQEGMGHFGRITSLDDLPPRGVLIAYVREAIRLNAEGIKAPRRASAARKELPIPEAFQRALDDDPTAAAAFAAMPPSHRREYVEWIADAKREDTRVRRIGTAVEWISHGKQRNWKYVKGGSE